MTTEQQGQVRDDQDTGVCAACRQERPVTTYFATLPDTGVMLSAAICEGCMAAYIWSLSGRKLPDQRGAVRKYTLGYGARQRKLTPEQVQELRERYASGTFTQRALGEEYGLTSHAVNLLINGHTYREVPMPELAAANGREQEG